MNIYVHIRRRRLIPRWRTFAETARRGELAHHASGDPATTTHSIFANNILESRTVEWLHNRTLGHATDLLGASLVVGRRGPAIFEAARFVLDSASSNMARDLAKAAIGKQGFGDNTPQTVGRHRLYAQVRTLKAWTSCYPMDAIAWIDLARTYSILGQERSAVRCIEIAVRIAGNNRFVLRSAGRFWFHVGDLERAHDLFRRSPVTQSDPWLLAAEIALGGAAGRQSRLLRHGHRMLRNMQCEPMHVSELAAELATLELDAGNLKKAKKQFAQAIIEPTENTIAQVLWVLAENRRLDVLETHLADLDAGQAFEARTRGHYSSGKWKNVVDATKDWSADEPFAKHPYELGSYVAAVALDDYVECKEIAQSGLVANSGEFSLLNNLAFACGRLCEIETARASMAKISKSQLEDEKLPVFLATSGLVEYRSGNVEAGRRYYGMAVEELESRLNESKPQFKDYDKTAFAVAVMNWATEESRIGGTYDPTLYMKAKSFLEKSHDPIAPLIRNKMTAVEGAREDVR